MNFTVKNSLVYFSPEFEFSRLVGSSFKTTLRRLRDCHIHVAKNSDGPKTKQKPSLTQFLNCGSLLVDFIGKQVGRKESLVERAIDLTKEIIFLRAKR